MMETNVLENCEQRTQNKNESQSSSKIGQETGFKNVTKSDLIKDNIAVSKESGLTKKRIFEETAVTNINRENKYRILRTLDKGTNKIKLNTFN